MPESNPIKYESPKTAMYVYIISIIVLLLTSVFVLPVAFIGVLVCIGLAMSFITGYRGIWLYEDKLRMVDFFGGFFYEIFYDDIANTGFLRSVEPLSRRGFYDDRESSALVILQKDGKRTELPRMGLKKAEEVLQFISARIDPEGPPSYKGAMIPVRHYGDLVFESSKTSIIAAGVIWTFLLILGLFSIHIKWYAATGFFVVALLALGSLIKGFYDEYMRIVILSDRLAFLSITKHVIKEIYFSDITHVGFLHTGMKVSNALDNDGNLLQEEKFIILLSGGGREILEDISNQHDLCAYIQERIGQS